MNSQLCGLINLEPKDVVEPFDFLDGAVEFALGFCIAAVELTNGLFVTAVFLFDLEFVSVGEVGLEFRVLLSPSLSLTCLAAIQPFQT